MTGGVDGRHFDCDPGKRNKLAAERGFDLLGLSEVFSDEKRLDLPDLRFDYGEERRVTIGRGLGRLFTVVYTRRGETIWLITAWPASQKERARYEA